MSNKSLLFTGLMLPLLLIATCNSIAQESDEIDVKNTIETANAQWDNSKYIELAKRYSTQKSAVPKGFKVGGFTTASPDYPIWFELGDKSFAYFVGVTMNEFESLVTIRNTDSTCTEVQSFGVPSVHCTFRLK